MAQRILEPGQIETLAKASIPRVRPPDRQAVFARRAARLGKLAAGSALGDYLQFLAALADAQHAALAHLSIPMPSAAQLARAGEHGMPPIHASTWPRAPQWRETLEFLCAALDARTEFPAGVHDSIAAIRRASPVWLEAQAAAILEARNDAVDIPVAPIVMAALQVHWVALAARFAADEVKALDVPGVCPLCGSLPVASLVYAQAQYQGYRYLHCSLCATEWHMVRVLCSQCGASGKSIAYHSLEANTSEANASGANASEANTNEADAAGKTPNEEGGAAVRAETCEQCRAYRKILYQEKDTGVEPVADDVASVALDLLLGEEGYHRASGNPLLWLPNTI
jgi:FdhE protein